MEMSDENMLESLAGAIVKLGYSQEQADEWAVMIGDTPAIDGDQLVVMDGRREVARLPLSAFPDFQ